MFHPAASATATATAATATATLAALPAQRYEGLQVFWSFGAITTAASSVKVYDDATLLAEWKIPTGTYGPQSLCINGLVSRANKDLSVQLASGGAAVVGVVGITARII